MFHLTRHTTFALLFGLFSLPLCSAQNSLTLPTKNTDLLNGKEDQYYMYVDRNFNGVKSKPWTAGTYGFVRNKIETADGVICTKFHEGIDVTPISRDASGKPLDEIFSVSAGVVAHASTVSSNSNYGKYLVIEHPWECGSIFSLSGHLAEIHVKPGEPVTEGQKVATMGYTGVGLNRERAHLHLEFSIMLSTRFQDWYVKHYGSKNFHGNHNGINLMGLDFAAYYIALQKNKDLTLPEFIETIPVHYKVTAPRKKPLEIIARYPWLAKGDLSKPSPSWEISLSSSGFPVAIHASDRKVPQAVISYIVPCKSKHEHFTKKFVTGTGNRASLTKTGKRFIELLTGDF